MHATVSLEEYAERVGPVNPTTRRVQTLNQNGSMMCYTTELTEAFLAHCREPQCMHVLEIGCGFGIKSSQIVQTGVFLTANDIEKGHLEKMQLNFAELSKTDPCFQNVQYLPGNFADLQKHQLGNQKYNAILCESVLHFMLPEEIRKTLQLCHTSLVNGGKIYITNLSPYQIYREAFATNQANGMEWPGLFRDPAGISPVIYNILDEEMLIRELKRAGFRTLLSKYIQKPLLEGEFQYDGRDWLIAIAEKE